MDNPNLDRWLQKRKARLDGMSAEVLFDQILNGDMQALSAGITLVESKNDGHSKEAQELIQKCLPHAGNAIRVGITGVPGVGKSSFIEAFGKVLTDCGKKVAVLAVDPSSSISGGSILGDKTRMASLVNNENAFIRPSAAGDTLGGVARKTRESIILCEAAGFDLILIETVGVGQSETVVKSMVDFFLLLMLSGAGDELQGIKKGIMEMADALVITKADGDNVRPANRASQEYRNAMHLFPPNENEWIPQVFTCSALEGTNIERVYEVIQSFENQVRINGWFEKNRREQDKKWLRETLNEMLLQAFYNNDELGEAFKDAQEQMAKGEVTSFQAAEKLFELYRKHGNI
ncbi:MAG: methylmalonyl Co-A mutase-associated GTPase MeaB [bacterium]|nr:methylmalonyl Co-A mutase-associated GTPase MeaB [bacterium]